MSDTTTTDEKLIEAIGRGDYVSYNKLFERYYTHLCQYVYGLLMDKSDAEDVVQELFLKIWKNREKIEIKENVSGYLYRMAKHLALNQLRSKVYFRFSSVRLNRLRNKLLANYLKSGGNELATVRISAFCVAMLSNNSFICKYSIFFRKYELSAAVL